MFSFEKCRRNPIFGPYSIPCLQSSQFTKRNYLTLQHMALIYHRRVGGKRRQKDRASLEPGRINPTHQTYPRHLES